MVVLNLKEIIGVTLLIVSYPREVVIFQKSCCIDSPVLIEIVQFQ